jgi:hypothetical protein
MRKSMTAPVDRTLFRDVVSAALDQHLFHIARDLTNRLRRRRSVAHSAPTPKPA